MEDIGETLSQGFGVWKSNLNLCIPFLLSILASFLIFLPLMAATIWIVMPQEVLSGLSQTPIQDPSAMQEMLSGIEEDLKSLPLESALQLSGLFLVLIVLVALVNSFFTAGAVGMARQALERGRSETSSMWSAGRRHFWALFLATLIVSLLTLAGLVFLLPALAVGPQLDPELVLKDPEALGLLVGGVILFVIYALALSIVLVAVPYALVLEDARAVQAISLSLNFFRYNKFDVVVLWLVVLALSMGLQMLSGAFSSGEAGEGQPLSAITGMLNLLVLAPLSNLWWTRLYMSRKGMLRKDETEDPW